MRGNHTGRHKIFLIDGTAFCYRAFHAIRGLSTSDGRPSNAIYGFATMLQALEEKENPTHLAVAFDAGKPTFRHAQFEHYKAHRKPMPDALIAQLPVVKELLRAFRIPVFEREGYEGEDILATIAKRMAGKDADVFLVTADKDVLQLVNGTIKVYNPSKEPNLWDAEAVRRRYGVSPEGMVDLMSLMGDATDNIPGAEGIGEKIAVKLMQKFGSVEKLYERLDEVESESQRAHLERSRKDVILSRELVRIDADVPIDVSLDAIECKEPDWKALRSLFKDLEFKRLLSALDDKMPSGDSRSVNARYMKDARAFSDFEHDLSRVSTSALGCWVLDYDSKGYPEALLFGITLDGKDAWILRFDKSFSRSANGKRFSQWLSDSSSYKIAHDMKRAKRLCAALGLTLEGVRGDTMIAGHLVNPAKTAPSLEDLSEDYLDERLATVSPRSKESDAQLLNLGEDVASAKACGPYAQAVCAVLRVHAKLLSNLKELGLARSYTELELPLVSVLADMEETGIALDTAYLRGLRATMDEELLRRTEAIYKMAQCHFNLNSPKQLADVLFKKLNLPVVKRTKTGPSTDSEVLRQLSSQHPLPKELIAYRELAKLVSTYVDALPRLVNPATGRIHTSLNQTATATGRLSSSDPNLQNIPIKTELGRSIRKAFVAGRADNILIAADYSQIELRILAHLSEDEQLCEAFRKGRDIHRFTASLIYGMKEDEVQPEQRSAMKAVNFGILYGMSAHGLSRELGIGIDQAQDFIDAYFKRYPGVRAYIDRQIEEAKRQGFVLTIMGRRRYIPELSSPDGTIRQFGERIAINTPIQGTAADLIKRAMIQLNTELKEIYGASMLLQVHDELLFECARDVVGKLITTVRHVMEGAIAIRVPLAVTVKTGANWLEMSEYHS